MPDALNGSPSLSRSLYEEIRARIADGTFVAGSALPSTRALAAERGLSRATVSLVYEQLTADGFLETRPGAASRVALGAAAHRFIGSDQNERLPGTSRLHGGKLSAFGSRIAATHLQDSAPTGGREIDFVYGPLAGLDFPTLAWRKALRAAEGQRSSHLAYEDPRGNSELRKALHTHLSQARGLSFSLEQLVIVNGSQQALDLCARLLIDAGDTVVVENPGYRMAHHVFEAYGAELVCVDVDTHGLHTDQLAGLGQAQMLYVTPTHQFPLGSFLPVGRRRALLDWAADRKVWIIEDDYDSEYRYSVRPEATLMSLDTRGCVIHVGTFSKTLSPQLRLGYMVLPSGLVNTFAAAKRLADRHAATGAQRALALLLNDGTYDRHLRRIRRKQQARQRVLVESLALHLGERVEVQGAASGLHLIVWFPALPAIAEPLLVEAARELGTCVYPVGPLYHPSRGKAEPRRAGLIMGYALLDHRAIDEGVRRLAVALERVETNAANAH